MKGLLKASYQITFNTYGVTGRNPKTGETADQERQRQAERKKIPFTEEEKYMITGGVVGNKPKDYEEKMKKITKTNAKDRKGPFRER